MATAFAPAVFGSLAFAQHAFGNGPCPGPGPCGPPGEEVPPQYPPDGGGRGSGPTHGIRPEYRDYYEDSLRESRIARIKRQDDEIIEFIVTLITKDII